VSTAVGTPWRVIHPFRRPSSRQRALAKCTGIAEAVAECDDRTALLPIQAAVHERRIPARWVPAAIIHVLEERLALRQAAAGADPVPDMLAPTERM
jgi:hypothetical protein